MPAMGMRARWRATTWPAVVLAATAMALACAGAAFIARADLAERRAAFETDARIAHRLLSQRVVQHDAILATLALLQPGGGAEAAPEQRLPSVYPQVLRVLRRDAGAAWADAAAAQALVAAEEESRRLQRAVAAGVDLPQGRYWLVRAAAPASFALLIDAVAMVPTEEWPIAPGAPVRVALAAGDGSSRTLHDAALPAGGWRFEFSKYLAAESQPFDVRLAHVVRWRDLPWFAMAVWVLAVALVAAGSFAAWRQRAARRRAEELLRLGHAGRLDALGELAAGMAHELNQPLTALLASVRAAERLLDDDPPDLATARGAMAQAAGQARRAGDVVGRLRRLVERPELGARLQPLRLDETLGGALALLAPDCRRLGVETSLEVQPAAATVQAEPVALEQIVHNLLSNALHALEQVPPGERRLALSVAAEGGQVVLAVRDSGPGIAPEALPRLFEPFFTTREGGLGLGLSLCETLAAGMGGSLSARNATPRGAEFRLALPLAAA